MLHNPWLAKPEQFDGTPISETGLHGGLVSLANRLLGTDVQPGHGYGSCTVIGETHVLKIAPYPYHRGRFDHERAISGLELPGVKVPEIVDEGVQDDYEWALIERVAGRPAYESWNQLTPASQSKFMQHLADCVAVIQRFRIDESLLHSRFDNWQLHVEAAVNRALNRADGMIPNEVLERAGELRDQWSTTLFDQPRVTCHGDLWFGNLLMDEPGNLVGIIDWDRLASAPVEYELDMTWRFWRYPWDFVPVNLDSEYQAPLIPELLASLVAVGSDGLDDNALNRRLSMLELAYRIGVTARFGWSSKHKSMIENVLDGAWASEIVRARNRL